MQEIPTSAWRYVGEAPAAGRIVPVDGDGLGPLLLIGQDAATTCLSNVCTHRGAVLLDEPAQGRSRLRCRYHGRCFGPDGRVVSAPGFDVAPDEPLVQLQVGRWGSAVFAAHQPTIPFEAWLPDEPEPPDRTAGREYELDVPWTLYLENFLEGLHVPFAHPGLNAALDQTTYATEVRGHAVLQTCEDVRWWFLFPTTMLNVYPWGVSLNAVQPLGPALTRVRYVTYGEPPQGWGVDLHATELEDQAVVRSVARGTTSPLFAPGSLSPGREQGVAAFRDLLVSWLGGNW